MLKKEPVRYLVPDNRRRVNAFSKFLRRKSEHSRFTLGVRRICSNANVRYQVLVRHCSQPALGPTAEQPLVIPGVDFSAVRPIEYRRPVFDFAGIVQD